jgi:hypothetical protein
MRLSAFLGLLALVCATAVIVRSDAQSPTAPQFTGDNKLVRPKDYREWIYLSSGLGMNYNGPTEGVGQFTNVFVLPAAYRQFLKDGHWPDGTMFVLEERNAESKGSIVRSGHYQSDLAGLAASVKDEKRFNGKWAYFVFEGDETAASEMPQKSCWSCHNSHAAVDNTFVQFYPTLKPLAERFGTYDAKKAEQISTAQ